jgi:hypothetical protein
MDEQVAAVDAAPSASEAVAAPVVDTPAQESESEESILEGAKEGKEGTPEDAKQPKKEKYKVKYGDVEEEVDLEQLKKSYTLDKVLTKRGQEAAAKAKEVEAKEAQIADLLSSLKDPERAWDILAKLGHDPDELAMQRAYKKYEYEQLSPEQKEALKYKQEAERAKAELAERKKSEEEAANQARAQEVEAEIESDITAVNELLGQELSPLSVERIAQAYQVLYNSKGVKPKHQEVAAYVRRFLDQDLGNFFKGLSADKAAELLPQELLSALKQRFIKEAEKKLPFSSTARGSANGQQEVQKKKLTLTEWERSIGLRK